MDNTTAIMADGDIDLYARLAAFNSHIYCPVNYSCSLDCNDHATACYNLTFECTTPELCQVDDCNQTQGIWCPIGWWERMNNYTDNPGNYLEWQFLPVDKMFLPSNYGRYRK